jgi:hypothetical protein
MARARYRIFDANTHIIEPAEAGAERTVTGGEDRFERSRLALA